PLPPTDAQVGRSNWYLPRYVPPPPMACGLPPDSQAAIRCMVGDAVEPCARLCARRLAARWRRTAAFCWAARSATALSLPPSGGLVELAASAANATAGITAATEPTAAISFLTKNTPPVCREQHSRPCRARDRRGARKGRPGVPPGRPGARPERACGGGARAQHHHSQERRGPLADTPRRGACAGHRGGRALPGHQGLDRAPDRGR